MKLHFFPREREFWLYHLIASGIVAAITAMSALLWSRHAHFNATLALVWIIPFTFAALVFRWHYKTRQWDKLSMGRLVPLVLIYAAIVAVLMMSLLALIVMPFFWHGMVQEDNALTNNAIGFISQFILTGSLQLHITVCAWFILYISFSKNKEVKERELSNLQLQAHLKDAQLSNLSNQLNPHFLFNALNNIRFLMHENVPMADDTLVALSELLRYSLESAKHEKVSVAQEIEIVERYMLIAKIQHEDRLQFTMSIPSAMYTCLLPPMLLQMLIENAVKHGIENLSEGGRITLRGELGQGEIHFHIENDIPQESSSQKVGFGIGLQNIAKRLRLLYGDKMHLTTTTNAHSFIVQLSMPQEKEP
ncbi:sensor histidine kinase [Undibacterium sp. Ji22W]|uniref:sensor histidine kinase n=1 Tax=Undibacterium sp. Ji22W TaxID=3413038 RepID=UPI003BF19C16